jgi:L-alanine-DL-glutamate epimerase-like enolase superfamily enzyme
MKFDAIGVLVKDTDGAVKEHKLGRRAGKRGMGIGVALGLIAAIPTGGLSLVGGVLGGAAAGGVIGQFFRKGLKMTDADAARIGRELHAGRAAVGVLAWDFEAKAVADKLVQLGGTPQTHEVAELTAFEA